MTYIYYEDLISSAATEAAESMAQQLISILEEKAFAEMHYNYQDDLRETVDPFKEDEIYEQMVSEADNILDEYINNLP